MHMPYPVRIYLRICLIRRDLARASCSRENHAIVAIDGAFRQIARYLCFATCNVTWVLGPREPDGLTMFEERPTYQPAAIALHLREPGVACYLELLLHGSTGGREGRGACTLRRGRWASTSASSAGAGLFERDLTALRFDDASSSFPAIAVDRRVTRSELDRRGSPAERPGSSPVTVAIRSR